MDYWLKTAFSALFLLVAQILMARGQDPPPPVITQILSTNSQNVLRFSPYPAAQEYKILYSPNLLTPFVEDYSGSFSGFDWTKTGTDPMGFFRLEVNTLDSNALASATILNRIAYGPTVDELERIGSIGPDAYLREQLAPELISEQLDIDLDESGSGWQYVTATGSGSSSTLYIYLNTPGEGYIDDLKLVAGTVPEAGANLIRNGNFELPLSTNDWTISSNHFKSALSTEIKHSGNSSLHLVATSGGTTRASSIWQTIRPGLSNSQRYTISFWYLPSPNPTTLTVRLSGSGIVASWPQNLISKLNRAVASIDDLRAWHTLHAVRSKRQLVEVLLQFLENHFVTEYNKSRDYFDAFYDVGTLRGWLATQLEFKEIQRWRQALLNPACTFYDLLRISAESPAMIIYLDTVNSKGNGSNVANENYARELLELFTFGVDNGYDQNDIVATSRAWTGWSVNIVATTNEFNPFAPRSTTRVPGATSGAVSNLVGVWTFNYKSANHNTSSKTIFPGKTVPERFGPPWAGRNYQLSLPARTGTNGIKDGYQIIAHLADLPFTQEYISVKLCRLFVHDDFEHGYDFRDPNLSPESQLIQQCMMAWENSSPKGQIRKVLETIFRSELFRSHAGSMQKVKTPLEFTVSAIRAFRSANSDGTFTADSDGFLQNQLERMGGMRLFDRAEPDGYPEAGPPWISAGTLAERVRFVQALLIAPNQSGRADAGNSRTDPVRLLKNKLPAASWNDAGAVADYFLSLLYPAEGEANLGLYRAAAIHFLNTADNGFIASPFNLVSSSSVTYDNRVRGVVAMLMTLPRFQEQ